MDTDPIVPSQETRPYHYTDPELARISEQLCADLIERWQRGERVPVEAYLRQHPLLGIGRNALELILTEVMLRQEYGLAAPLEEFLWRFPGFDEPLRRHFAILEGFVSAGGPPSTDGVPTNSPPVVPRSSADSLPDLPGFEIAEQIGRGGMGIVYKARETSLGRNVALKLLRDDHACDPDRLARFQREARTASALNHPGICTVHALSEQGGRPFIVMELIEGLTLRALTARRPEPDEVASLIGQSAMALAAAHAAGVVHRDIKPENIIVRADGHVKVLDFGLARLLPEAILAGPGSATDAGAMAGTLTYMSPEQTRSEPVGSASDVFSLGIVAYELATLRHPFEGQSALGTLNAIATASPIPPRRLNPLLTVDLESLLLQMLEKDPRLRPTAAEIGAALGRAPGTRFTPAAGTPLTPGARQAVGRDAEREALWSAFDSAEGGRGLLFCATGEPGIGKTTLVEDWLRALTAGARAAGIGRGRCSERLAGTGSYLPVLEALEGLLRGESGSLAARLMRDCAPTWYVQVTPSPPDPSVERPAAQAEASTPERLKREFLDFVTEMGRHRPLVLFFDDLHWADASTADLLAWLGRHATRLRLLVVATYRPTEMLSGKNPFVPVQLELQRHGACRELALRFLTPTDVGNYLALEFPGHDFPAEFAAGMHAQTEGNPLFLVELVRHLRDGGVIATSGDGWTLARPLPDFQQELPASVRSLIRKQLDRLDEHDLRLLSVGSVQGYEFDAAVLAAVLGRSPADIEERLEFLDRVQGLVRLVREHEFPDGTLTLRYRFVHVLYQNTLYAAIPPSRRTEWSAAVAQALLTHYGDESPLVASELALLFEIGRDWMRAAEHFYLAAKYPLRLRAHREAAVLARRGLEMLERLPETPERARQEVRLQFALGIALQPSEGLAAPEVVEAYRRAQALSQVEIDATSHAPLLWGLWSFRMFRAEYPAAMGIACELWDLARGQTDPAISLPAHHGMGYSHMMCGDPVAAWSHLGLDFPAEAQAVYGRDVVVPFRAHGAVVLWLLGYPDLAVERARRAVARAREKLDLYGLAIALFNAGKIHQLRQEAAATTEHANALLVLAEEQGFPVWRAAGAILTGWALARQGEWQLGSDRIREGLAAYRTAGAAMMQTHFLGLLAESLGIGGQFEEGLDVLDRAFDVVETTGERYCEAELHRLRGELLWMQSSRHDCEAEVRKCFGKAQTIAGGQHALALEFRAAIGAAHLAQSRSRAAEARALLEPIARRFTEGFQTPDWREAQALLEART